MDLKIATLDQLPDEIKEAIVDHLAPEYRAYRAVVSALAARLGDGNVTVKVTKEEIDALANKRFQCFLGQYSDGIEITLGDAAYVDAAMKKHQEFTETTPCNCEKCVAARSAGISGDESEALKQMIYAQALLNAGGLPN